MIAWLLETAIGALALLGLAWLTDWWLWPGPQLALLGAGLLLMSYLRRR